VQVAYGSSKDIQVYQAIGLNPSQIFIIGKVAKKYRKDAVVTTVAVFQCGLNYRFLNRLISNAALGHFCCFPFAFSSRVCWALVFNYLRSLDFSLAVNVIMAVNWLNVTLSAEPQSGIMLCSDSEPWSKNCAGTIFD